MSGKRVYDIEDRLIDFAVRIIKLAESLPKTLTGKHVSSQILRSGTSPAPNYGEAHGAESNPDFIHKMKICLKELRETRVWLIIISKSMLKPENKIELLLKENEELISIFVASIKTAKENRLKEERRRNERMSNHES
ncbi:MAG: four helix bundle protein [Fibrobacter sp.]|jgi:four helix bundle protein|nr:four helix bundle protein [Fibrobacter sp.]